MYVTKRGSHPALYRLATRLPVLCTTEFDSAAHDDETKREGDRFKCTWHMEMEDVPKGVLSTGIYPHAS